MNFVFDLEGRPGLVSAGWIDALSGGRLNMRVHAKIARAMKLPAKSYVWLDDKRAHDVGCQFNPTVINIAGRLYVNVRVCNIDSAPAHTTKNLFGYLDGDKIEGGWLDDSQFVKPYIYGFEDLRLFWYKGAVHAIAAISTSTTTGCPRTRQALLRIEDQKIVSATIFQSSRHEKNWMPVVDNDQLKLVYATDPLVVLAHNAKTGLVEPPVDNVREITSMVRGSSQLVPFNDGWLAVVHECHRPEPTAVVYTHRFAFFDKGLSKVQIGTPFYLNRVGIEFVAGLAEHEGEYVLSYGVIDRAAWLTRVTKETIEAMLDNNEVPEVKPKPQPNYASLPPGNKLRASWPERDWRRRGGQPKK